MSQMQSNGPVAGAVMPVEAVKKTQQPSPFAGIISKEEAQEIKAKILADGGREFAAQLAKDARERPAVKIDERGRLVPTDFESLWRIAVWIESLHLYGTRQKGGGVNLYSVAQIAAIVAAGLRVGMDPFYALETIALINNRTSIWGRGVRGVIMASGLCEDWQEERVGFDANGVPGEQARVTVTLKRKGIPTPFVGMFSIALATRAGLIGDAKDWTWGKYLADMLTWRAVGRASLGFSDVLGGMTVAEEIEDPVLQPGATPTMRDKLEAAKAAATLQPYEGTGRVVVVPGPSNGVTPSAIANGPLTDVTTPEERAKRVEADKAAAEKDRAIMEAAKKPARNRGQKTAEQAAKESADMLGITPGEPDAIDEAFGNPGGAK